MQKKKGFVVVAAALAAIAGAAVAVVTFMKRKGKKISDELDFDDAPYYDEDASELEISIPDDDDSEEAGDAPEEAPEDIPAAPEVPAEPEQADKEDETV